ncbi:MAG: nucleotidyltransferase family protein [Bacteroidales bacterium]|nr:nucleotidyltransferase family protein [Bacteroidales bacterium]
MRAMILAAGLGTRLKPLTDNTPKALVPFKGTPMVERVIRNLAEAGVDNIMVNVHHFGDQVIQFLDSLVIKGVSISISDESNELMDTGGALLQARQFLMDEEDFLVHNVDVFTNLNIGELIRTHKKSDALATIAVKKRPTSRSLLFDNEGLLCGWKHNETGEARILRPRTDTLKDFGNTCIQVISRDFFNFFQKTEPRSLTEMYLELANHQRIVSFVHNEDYWYDLGRYEHFIKADQEVF